MKKRIPDNLQIWVDARKRFRLSHAQIQMARELGMNPRRFGKLDNHRQEKWKLPLPLFIEELYFKHFGKEAPDQVISIEDKVNGVKLQETKPAHPNDIAVRHTSKDQLRENEPRKQESKIRTNRDDAAEMDEIPF